MSIKSISSAIAAIMLIATVLPVHGASEDPDRPEWMKGRWSEQQRSITDGHPSADIAASSRRADADFVGTAHREAAGGPGTPDGGSSFFERARRITDGSPE